MKKRRSIIIILTSALLLCGCSENAAKESAAQPADASQSSGDAAQSDTSGGESTPDSSADMPYESGDTESAVNSTENTVQPAADMFTDRDLSGAYSDCTDITLADGASACGSGKVKISGDTVTITAEGTYMLSGTLSDGQIVVDAGSKDKVQLVLGGAEISKKGSAAILVKKADKVFVTSAENTVNRITSVGEFTDSDSGADAAIFSREDISFNGSGSITVSSDSGHGIVSKDDLKIGGGTLEINAAKKGISGNDSVRAANGSISIASGTDAIHAGSTDDKNGFVYISGGNIKIVSATDGIFAAGTLTVDGGSFDIVTGGGAQSAGGRSDDNSYKALKSDTNITVNGGGFKINAKDDALHSGGGVNIAGGSFDIATGDDALHADDGVVISGGGIGITSCYEGIEGKTIAVSGGNISLISSDDGLNAAGGSDSSGFGGFHDAFAADGDCSIVIEGGTLEIIAEGDGIDSNGSILVSGGEVYISGPTKGGNGSIDCGIEAVITGGTVVCAGSSGMAENFGTKSTQCSLMYSFQSGRTGDEIKLTDENGSVLVSYTAKKNYQTVIVSTPDISVGKTYKLIAGENSQDIEMTDIIYGSGNGGFHPGHGDDRFPDRPGDVSMPDRPDDGDFPQPPGDVSFPDRPDDGDFPHHPDDGNSHDHTVSGATV